MPAVKAVLFPELRTAGIYAVSAGRFAVNAGWFPSPSQTTGLFVKNVGIGAYRLERNETEICALKTREMAGFGWPEMTAKIARRTAVF